MNLKFVNWVGLMALAALPLSGYSQPAPPPPPTTTTLSPAASEVVKLAESGTSDDVILGYVHNSSAPYNLSADNVVYLKDVGLSSPVIAAMLSHDQSPSGPGQTYVYNQQAYPPGQAPPPPQYPDQPPAAPPMAAPPSDGPPPDYVSGNAPPEVNYFYNDLSPYGSWVDLDGYGWCWQPSVLVVNHGWRPYCDGGHWVYSDAGWFWASDYSWGWAPFHYGRWQLHPRNGWVWFPDTTWAPAWVVWRSYGDGCGWAPLPHGAVFDVQGGFRFNGGYVSPGFDFALGINAFTFVNFHDFAGRDYVHHELPPAEVNRVFRQTTIINNYTVNNNHEIVNHGIPVEHVTAVTHTDIRPVAIHNVAANSRPNVSPGGTSTAVYRHELGTPPRITTPIVAQRVNNNHPVIQHTTATPSTTRRPTTTTSTPAYTPSHTTTQTQTYTAPQSHNQPAYSSTPSQPVRTTEPTRTTTTTTTTSHTSTTYNPSYTSVAAKQNPPVQNPPQGVTHVYTPKSYNQASSVHMLPPDPTAYSTRGSSSSSSSTKSSSSSNTSHTQSQAQGQSKQEQPPK